MCVAVDGACGGELLVRVLRVDVFTYLIILRFPAGFFSSRRRTWRCRGNRLTASKARKEGRKEGKCITARPPRIIAAAGLIAKSGQEQITVINHQQLASKCLDRFFRHSFPVALVSS